MSDQRGTFRWLRGAVFVVLGVLLTWQVLSRSLVAHLAEEAPEAALNLRSDDPAALINISELKLNLQHPVKDASTTEPGSDSSDRITSFARHGSQNNVTS